TRGISIPKDNAKRLRRATAYYIGFILLPRRRNHGQRFLSAATLGEIAPPVTLPSIFHDALPWARTWPAGAPFARSSGPRPARVPPPARCAADRPPMQAGAQFPTQHCFPRSRWTLPGHRRAPACPVEEVAANSAPVLPANKRPRPAPA